MRTSDLICLLTAAAVVGWAGVHTLRRPEPTVDGSAAPAVAALTWQGATPAQARPSLVDEPRPPRLEGIDVPEEGLEPAPLTPVPAPYPPLAADRTWAGEGSPSGRTRPTVDAPEPPVFHADLSGTDPYEVPVLQVHAAPVPRPVASTGICCLADGSGGRPVDGPRC